jgi:hypothetical protein
VFVGLGYNTLANVMVKFLIYRMLRNSTGNASMRVRSVADDINADEGSPNCLLLHQSKNTP